MAEYPVPREEIRSSAITMAPHVLLCVVIRMCGGGGGGVWELLWHRTSKTLEIPYVKSNNRVFEPVR